MEPTTSLGYIILWSYALLGLIFFSNKILKDFYILKKISKIPYIERGNFPVSKQNLDAIFEELKIYSI